MKAPEDRSPDLVTFGEAMGLITADGTGPLQFARQFHLSIGGAEINVAIGAARLGTSVTWFGRLGRDAVGDLIAYRLAAEGVQAIITREDSFTGLMVKHHRAAGITSVDYHRRGSAGSSVRPDDIPVETIERARVLHLTGITPALSPGARDTVMKAVEIARGSGTKVSFDVNYRSKLWSPVAAGAVLAEIVRKADIVFAGPAEAALVLGVEEPGNRSPLVSGLGELGPSEVILKDGAKGYRALIDGDIHDGPALKVQQIDPVGAGDAFVAGYLADYILDRSAHQCLATATASGAYAVTVPGDCDGLPNRGDLAMLNSSQDVAR
jgi:2-dehydro-3-deoxygluconokinase